MGTQIFELLPKVMRSIGAIAKSESNTQKGYKFRGIAAVMNAVSPALQEHAVTLSTKVHDYHLERIPTKDNNGKERINCHVTLLMDLVFHAPDGSEIVNTMAGEGLDYGDDKATNKAMAAAMKYSLLFGLCIPVHADSIEDSDRDQQRYDSTPVGIDKPATKEAKPPVVDTTAYDNAVKAIRAAEDAHTLDRYMNAAKTKFTAAQVTCLELMARERMNELIEPAGSL